MDENELVIYHNGKLQSSYKAKAEGTPVSGAMLQGFKLGKYFNGYITEFNVFDTFLGNEKMAQWTTCQVKLRGNIFSWNRQWLNLTSPTEDVEISLVYLRTVNFCEEKRPFTYQIFNDNNNLIDQIFASKMCKRVNGRLAPPPTNFEEMMEITAIAARRRTFNTWTSGRVRKRAEWTKDSFPANGTYDYYDDQTGENIEVFRENKNPFFELNIEKTRYSFIPDLCLTCGSLSCGNFKCTRKPDLSAALCQVKKHIWFKLSGLCSQSEVDRQFRLLEPSAYGVRNTYVGSLGWNMVYDDDLAVWKIENELFPDKSLSMKVTQRLPVGKFRWEIANSTCNEGMTEVKTLQSNCDKDQFTCDDGSCISLDLRCDSVEHCDDVSDEKNCKLVSLDPNKYLIDKPPKPLSSGKFSVNVSIDIMSILDIQEVGSILKLLFVLDLTWFDNRLQFYNLKMDENMNTMTSDDQNSIWTPTVLFANTEQQLTSKNDEKSFAMVKRLGNSTRSGNDYDEDISIFEGNQNSIRLSRSYDIEFICEYDMRWYPFDYQTCLMVVLMEGNTGKFVDLVDDLIQYSGPKELTQYFVKNVIMGIKDYGRMKGVLVVSVTLGRRLLGTILTIFLPTILLNLIGHATNFFKAFFFEAVVTVNLTGKISFRDHLI